MMPALTETEITVVSGFTYDGDQLQPGDELSVSNTLATSLINAGLAVTKTRYSKHDAEHSALATNGVNLDNHAAWLANYGLVIEPGTTLFVGPTNPSAQMSVGDVWIDSSAA